MDFAVPGYDNLIYSLSNICGQSDTYISQAQSSVCGDWYNNGASTIEGCSCDSLPEDTESQRIIKEGCQLFTAWGWKDGNPTINYKVVDCPSEYINYIGSAFDKDGINPPGDSNPTP